MMSVQPFPLDQVNADAGAATCAICATHSTNTVHSRYRGHPIVRCESWVTTTVHYHAYDWTASTLAGIRACIRARCQTS